MYDTLVSLTGIKPFVLLKVDCDGVGLAWTSGGLEDG